VAGVVNVAGFLAVQRLTTNVTGHFAFFVDEIFKLNFWQGFIYFLYIFFFFSGSFVSGMLTALTARKHERLMYAAPVIIESAILLLIGIFYPGLKGTPDIIAFSLLFAMGMQNSLVTTISNAAVRTTHLTGLFTDLGIELSQLFFYKSDEHKRKLVSSIRLRLTIISFFFLGGIAGGILYTSINLHTLMLASLVLITGLIYDHIKFRVIQLKRKYRTVETGDV
jgi:uncharacterized membrane protein YoaK (UPF0700 family)